MTLAGDFYTLLARFRRHSSISPLTFYAMSLLGLAAGSSNVFCAILKVGTIWRKSVVKQRHSMLLAAVLLSSFGFASCATSPIGDKGVGINREAERELVAERVVARWEALIKGDFPAAYAFLSPASRGAISLAQFEGRMSKGNFRAVQVDRVDCGAEACTVKLWLTYDHPQIKGMRAAVEEIWIFDHGQAWYVYRG